MTFASVNVHVVDSKVGTTLYRMTDKKPQASITQLICLIMHTIFNLGFQPKTSKLNYTVYSIANNSTGNLFSMTFALNDVTHRNNKKLKVSDDILEAIQSSLCFKICDDSVVMIFLSRVF